jgi:hypothetical protein
MNSELVNFEKTKRKRKNSKNECQTKASSLLLKVKTEEERRAASKEILKQLEGLELSISHKPIRELLKLLKQYNEEGNRIVVNIPFPELNRRIKGVLATSIREETYVVLKHEKF